MSYSSKLFYIYYVATAEFLSHNFKHDHNINDINIYSHSQSANNHQKDRPLDPSLDEISVVDSKSIAAIFIFRALDNFFFVPCCFSFRNDDPRRDVAMLSDSSKLYADDAPVEFSEWLDLVRILWATCDDRRTEIVVLDLLDDWMQKTIWSITYFLNTFLEFTINGIFQHLHQTSWKIEDKFPLHRGKWRFSGYDQILFKVVALASIWLVTGRTL